MKKIHHKTAKSTIMQLHIKTQAANKSWSYEEQTGHTPDGYVGIPNVHNGSLLQSYWRVELVCKEKDRNKSEPLRWERPWGFSPHGRWRSREEVRLPSSCSCTWVPRTPWERFRPHSSAATILKAKYCSSHSINRSGINRLNKPGTA